MKKILVLSAAAFCFISASNAQSNYISTGNDMATINRKDALSKKEKKEQQLEKKELEKKEISFQTSQHFYEDFGNLPVVKSERTPYFDEVTFLKDGKAQIAFYDDASNLVGTMEDKAFEDLPVGAQNFINKHYSDYTIEAVRFFDDNEANDTNMNLYDHEFEDEDSYFVELAGDSRTIVLHVTLDGAVYFFHELK